MKSEPENFLAVFSFSGVCILSLASTLPPYSLQFLHSSSSFSSWLVFCSGSSCRTLLTLPYAVVQILLASLSARHADAVRLLLLLLLLLLSVLLLLLFVVLLLLSVQGKK